MREVIGNKTFMNDDFSEAKPTFAGEILKKYCQFPFQSGNYNRHCPSEG